MSVPFESFVNELLLWRLPVMVPQTVKVHAYIHVCVRVCVCLCMFCECKVWDYSCICAWLHVCIYACVHVFLFHASIYVL